MALPKYCVIHPNLDDLSGLSGSKISYDKKQTDLFLLFGLHHIFISLKIFHILKQFHIVFCMYKCTYKHLQNDTSKKKKKTKKMYSGRYLQFEVSGSASGATSANISQCTMIQSKQ